MKRGGLFLLGCRKNLKQFVSENWKNWFSDILKLQIYRKFRKRRFPIDFSSSFYRKNLFSRFAIEKTERLYRKFRKTQITIEFGGIIYRKMQKWELTIILQGHCIGKCKKWDFRYTQVANVSGFQKKLSFRYRLQEICIGKISFSKIAIQKSEKVYRELRKPSFSDTFRIKTVSGKCENRNSRYTQRVDVSVKSKKP